MSGYHETKTLFWLAITSRFLRLEDDRRPLGWIHRIQVRGAFVPDLFLENHSTERITSRRAWQVGRA